MAEDRDQQGIGQDQAGIRFPPPFVYLGFLLIGLGLDRIVGWGGFGLAPMMRIAAGVIATIGGLTVIFLAQNRFRTAGTPTPPWMSVTTIVGDGIYSATRNPMYLGMAFTEAGLAICFDSLLALLLTAVSVAIVHFGVIAREERYLDAKFGDNYRRYRDGVPRWL